MKKIAALVMTAVGALAAPGLEGRAAAGTEAYENYVVRPGDTLGGIAGRVLGKPGRWREILRENPQVTNPNRIYPGDTLRIPVPESAAAAAPAAGLEAVAGAPAAAAAGPAAEAEAAPGAGEAAGAPAAQPEPELPVRVVSSVEVVNRGLYRAAGYIADRLPDVAVIASQDGREVLGPGDAAIINAPVMAGTRFTVVRADRRVYHPATGQPLGWLVRVLGTAEATCRWTTTSTAVMGELRDAASVGDYLVPWSPEEEPPLLAPKGEARCVRPGPPDGMIVAFDEARHAVAEQELVYIDRGSAAGVVPGARFQIYRPVWPECEMMVGELQVLKTGHGTATALVTTSLREVQVTDLLRAE